MMVPTAIIFLLSTAASAAATQATGSGAFVPQYDHDRLRFFHHLRQHGPPTAIKSMEDPTLLEQLGISATIGLVANTIVDRTGMKDDLIEVEPTVDDHDAPPSSALLLYGIAESVDDAAWVYFTLTLIAAIDKQIDIHYVAAEKLIEAAPTIAVTIGAARALSIIKKTFFLQRISGTKLGRTQIFDNLIDFILALCTASVILSELELDDKIGMGVKSIFAVSGVSALFFSIVSKDLAEHLTAGLAIQAWDAFDVGEIIKLGNGVQGKVVSIGLVETEIEGTDLIVTKIPNSKLVKEHVSNLSRAKKSKVQQTLRFSYGDIKKVPKVLSDIQEEIEASCPKLDWSSARLKSYEPDHIEAEVNCQFDCPPTSYNESGRNREQVLLAIASVIDKNDVTFAIPAINYPYLLTREAFDEPLQMAKQFINIFSAFWHAQQ